MQLATQNKKAEFQSLLPSVNQNMAEWQAVSARLPGSSPDDMAALAKRLQDIYAEKEGLILPLREKVVMLQRVISNGDSATFKAELEQKLPGKGYNFTLRQMDATVLKQVEANFIDRDENKDSLFHQRLARPDNRVLVIDDDFFYRALLQKECEVYAKVHQAEDGKDALKLYQEINPDIVFLDIHLPSSPGLNVLQDITALDFDACVIMLTSDTSRYNILQSVKRGSSGVLKKPPESGKILRIFRNCPTFKRPGEQREAAKV
jgi:two-component system, chemotaxis family, chemotaxis protein CheY